MVDVEQVGVEVDMETRGRFDRGPCAFFDEEMARDGREGGPGREGDKRGGVGVVGAGNVVDLDEIWMARLLPCRGVWGNGHHWSLIDPCSLVDEWPRLCWIFREVGVGLTTARSLWNSCEEKVPSCKVSNK